LLAFSLQWHRPRARRYLIGVEGVGRRTDVDERCERE
jgi:hypothetical protein